RRDRASARRRRALRRPPARGARRAALPARLGARLPPPRDGRGARVLEPAAGRARGGARARGLPLALLLLLRDGPLGEEVILELVVELGIAPSDPLEDHRGVLLLLVPVVDEDLPELLVLARVDALV